ncbi:capsular exopolysaccharide family [Nakamurella panacisegetis]|uniref:non-specific protein-tyrosine kinase n=1 Tax=Nakamurella panacisegetis TaxID=1090615 RepID=A0A1H0IIE3_9ACTN|nr:polysaccharide biosynthesis tyrosine autokinase [Nakamurella panacisegetis]SDO31214.1 capsular exopolysaccharide family [Nakamurella panacisegetis]
MELRTYVAALRKLWWAIVLVTVVGAGTGAYLAYRQTPMYATTVTFFATTQTTSASSSSAFAGDQFAQQRVNTYVYLLSSDRLARLVIAASKVDLSVEKVESSISGASQLNTVLLTATVTDSVPSRSEAVADALATQFPALVNTIESANGTRTALVHLDVVDGPHLNPKPVSPRTKLYIALGTLIGLAIGVIVALLRELLDTTVRSVHGLSTLTDVPVLGVINSDSATKRSPLIVQAGSQSVRAEMFRQLRTSLQFVDVDQPASVIVVTSSVEKEGKSTTAANLAIAFADAGRRALLIDADLRRPKIADYLGLEGAVGLTNVLANQVDVDVVLQTWGASGLTVLVSGSIPPNPSELLGSQHMVDLTADLRTKFDVIIIDTPPLLPVTDAAVAATFADGAVIVVKHGKTKRSMVSRSVHSLRAVDARILGTVLNFAPTKGADAQRGYGPYGYASAATIDEAGAEPRTRRRSASRTKSSDRTGESDAPKQAWAGPRTEAGEADSSSDAAPDNSGPDGPVTGTEERAARA